jgi:sugar-specific transcriptional regulator TrmB
MDADESPISEEAYRVFEENLGLSSYECDVYLTLVDRGKQTMAEIAESSDVPKHRVYDVTEKLRDRGFIEIVDQYPKEAYAVPPDEVLEPVEEQLTQAKEEVKNIHQEVGDIGGGIAMMKSKSTIEKYLQKSIHFAEVDLAITLSFELLESHWSQIRSIDDSTSVKLVISDIPERYLSENSIELEGIDDLGDEVYGIKSHEPVVVSSDRAHGFFWTGFDSSLSSADMQGFNITNEEFALLFDRYINHYLIPQANELYTRTNPRELPTTYIRIQDCIRDLESRDIEGMTVEVHGYSTTTREQVHFTGDLVDYHSEEDIVAYLEVERHGFKGNESVRVGGWKATTLDDYEGRQITLSRKSDRFN